MKVAKRSSAPLLSGDIITGCKIYRKEVDSWSEHLEEGQQPTKYLEISLTTNQGFVLTYTSRFSYLRSNFLQRDTLPSLREVKAKAYITKRKSPISVDGLVQIKRFTHQTIFTNFDFTNATKRNIIRWNRDLMSDLGIDCDEFEDAFSLDSISRYRNIDLAKLKTSKHEIHWVGGQELLNKSMNALLRSLGKLEQVEI
jgi:hypothetical protein